MSRQSVLLAGAFALPVLCCLIGAGAFVLLVTPPAEAQDPNDIPSADSEVSQETLDEIVGRTEALRGQIEQQEERNRLLREIEQLIGEARWSSATILDKEPDLTRMWTRLNAQLRLSPSAGQGQVVANQESQGNDHGK